MKDSLSILIATMNRTSADFLLRMFPEHDLADLNIIIVNQTHKVKLEVDNPNIQVINSFEYGLSKSRNLAMQHCKTPYALLADDDLVYKKDFIEKIKVAYQNYPEAAMISFKLSKDDDTDYKDYPNLDKSLKVTGNQFMISSAEISLNLDKVKTYKLQFCTYFGLGAMFNCCEETLFLRSLIKRRAKAVFRQKAIAYHASSGTGDDPLNPDFIKALSACQFFTFGFGSFVWLVYYLYQVKKSAVDKGESFKTGFKNGSTGIIKAYQHKKAIIKQL